MSDFNFDYTSTMMMKMFLARPSDDGSEVLINFEQALNLIKRVDNITQHIPKIIYLVGWQYNGHDDRYPDIFEVNSKLGRECDESAYDSLMWLISEAKKYNTVVSFHINFADAYEDAELFPKLQEANALIRSADGKAVVVEEYNGKPCYKISYKEFWVSGLFQKHLERFINFMPIVKEQKTLHIDNFQCYFNNNPDIHVFEMQEYRNKMIDLVRSYGIDVTSEGAARECEAGKDNYNCKVPKEIMLASPLATLDRIPALWWLSPYGDNDFLNIPFSRLCGGLPGDEFFEVFYGSPHGEDVWLEHGCNNGEWEQTFIDKFACELVPYRFIIRSRCTRIDTDNDGFKTAFFENGTVSCGSTATVTFNGETLKHGADVAMPAMFLNDTYVFYSHDKTQLTAKVNAKYLAADLYRVTAEGNEFICEKPIENGVLKVDVKPYECVLAQLK